MDPFDELRFGASRTLNLRDAMPTGAEAVRIADGWLRAKQVERAEEVLIITGAGRGSENGVGVIREEIDKLLSRLRRQNVVYGIMEHTDGSVVVVLAPLRAMFEAAERRRDRTTQGTAAPTPENPAALDGLSEPVRARLRHLAHLSIDSLGVRDASASVVADEMQRWFARLATASADERVLASAIEGAISEYE